jgi:predicted acylesterase/phospholipase RssA
MTFKILALGGGGTKGILHIGAIKFLEEKYGNIQEHFTEGFYGCSIGSIFAIALAFGLKTEGLIRMAEKFSSFSEMLFNDLSIDKFKDSLTRKGLFDTALMCDFIAKMFDSEGIDLRGKNISDSHYPLFICAANLTKKTNTVFTGNVPILDAMAASCCIPLIFCPKIINDYAYIDGGYFTNIVLNFVPAEQRKETLSISIAHEDPKLSPSKIVKMSTVGYLYSLYMVSCLYEQKQNMSPNNIDLNHTLASGISDVGDKEREEMISRGYELTRSFFAKNA